MSRIDKVQSLGDYLAILRRRWPYLALIVPPILLLAVFLAFALPASYRSSATIMLEPSSISAELVKTTVITYADQQIELVRRRVMTTERMQTITAKTDPYPDLTDVSALEKARMIIEGTSIQKVDPVTLQPVVIGSAFTISYANSDPRLAADVAGQIAGLFLDFNRSTRVEQAQQAQDFLQKRSDELNKQISALDQQISEFKTRYGEALPDSRDRNESSRERLERDLDGTEAQLRVLQQQESLLKLQLGQISPTLVASGTDAYTQLGLLRSELAAAKQKYTPDHPDVKRLTRSIEALAAQANLGTPTAVRPDNPEYLRVAAELNSLRQNLAALTSNAQRTRAQIGQYDHRLAVAPTVERDYAQLTREYEGARAQFGEIQAKLRSAEMSQQLESGNQGERYTLIRGASIPGSPSAPNRLGIVMLGTILAFALGIGLVVFKESADPTVRGSNDLAAMAGGVPVLGAIPVLINDEEHRRFRLVWGGVAGVYALAALGVAATVLL